MFVTQVATGQAKLGGLHEVLLERPHRRGASGSHAHLQAVSPGLLRFGDGVHVAAVHGDGRYVGPASWSVPGYTFAPTKYYEPYVASTPTSCQMKRPSAG